MVRMIENVYKTCMVAGARRRGHLGGYGGLAGQGGGIRSRALACSSEPCSPPGTRTSVENVTQERY